MRFFRYGIVVSAILLLSACATAKLESVNNSEWKGADIKQVEAKWGAANQITHLPDGNSYYVYTTITYKNLYPSPVTSYVTMVGPGKTSYGVPVVVQNASAINQQTELYCTTVLETDKSGIVISVQHQGNNCVNPALLYSISNS